MGGKSVEQGPITPAPSGFPGPAQAFQMPALPPGGMEALADQMTRSMGGDYASNLAYLTSMYPGAQGKTMQPMPGLMPPGMTAPTTTPAVQTPPADQGFMYEQPYDSMSFHPNMRRR